MNARLLRCFLALVGFCFWLSPPDTQAQDWLWARTGGGTSTDIAYDVCVDNAGNSYVTGAFFTTATFGSQSVTSAGSYDIFVAKYDPNGNCLWARRAGGTTSDYGYGIACNRATGEVYVTGYYYGNVTFTSPTLNVNLTSSVTTTNYDIFFAKYATNGDLLWATNAGSISTATTDYGYDIAVDNAGNCYGTGMFYGTAQFRSAAGSGGPNLNVTSNVTTTNNDIFVCKYNTNGSLQWVRNAGGQTTDYGYGIACNGAGDVWVTGFEYNIFNNVRFGAITGFPYVGCYEIFVAKYNTAGAEQWVRTYGSTSCDYGWGIAVDANDNSYATGYYYTSMTVGATTLTAAGSADAYMIKHDSNGNMVWARTGGGTSADLGYDAAADDAGNNYYTGVYQQTPTFGTLTTAASAGCYDPYVVKLDANGNWNWFERAGGTSCDYGWGIDVSRDGCDIWATGYYSQSGDFGPTTLTANGNSTDMYVFRLTDGAIGGTLGPQPVIGPICENTPANGGTLTLSGFTGTITHWESSTDCIGFSNPTTINNTNPTYNWGPLTTTTCYRVYVEKGICTPAYSDTLQILIDPFPVLNATATPPSICIQQSSTLDVTSTVPATTFSWVPGNLNGPTHSVQLLFTTTYTVNAVTPQGCTNTANVTVTVNMNPVVTVTPPAASRCDIDPPATLMGNGAVNYLWQPGNLNTTSINVSPPAGNTTYSVVGTDANGCTGSAQASVTTVSTPAQPSAIAGATSPCTSPNDVRYSVTPVAGILYDWTISPTAPFFPVTSTGGPSIDVNWTTPGTYTITVTPLNTVGAQTCAGNPRTLVVTVNASPTQPGNITGTSPHCINESGAYSVANVPNATGYTWSVLGNAAGYVLGPNGANNMNIDWVLPGTYVVNVTADNVCGSSAPRTFNVTVNPTPPTSTLLINTTPVCPGRTGATYSVVNVAGTTYTWTVPAAVASITGGQGTNSITVNWSATAAAGNYNITVVPTALGCTGSPLTIVATVSPPAPAQPGAINGPSPVCQNQVAIYDVAAVPNATSYNWTGLPVGASITSGVGTNSITVNWGAAAPGFYTLGVTATNSCGTSPFQGVVVEVRSLPVQPGAITGPAVHCVGTSQNYTITPMANVDDYEWTNSCTGWTGASTTNQIQYTADANGPCVITVAGRNFCGTGVVRSLTVSPSDVPSQPSPINGPTPICRGSVGTYSVQNVAGVTYLWSGIPAGASFVRGQGTNQVEINWGTAQAGVYNLRVTPTNACGASVNFRELAVTVRGVPGVPTGFVGPTSLCAGGSGNYAVDNDPTVSYAWSASPAGATITNQGSAATVVFNNAGLYQLVVRATNECGAGLPLVATVNAVAPPTVNAGVDRVVCTANAVLAGSPSGGVWACEYCPGASAVVTAGSFGMVTGMGYGPHVFRYTVTSPECGAFSDYVLVENDRIVAGSLTGSATICEGTTGVLTLTGQTGLAKIVRWEYSTDNFTTLPTPIQNETASHTYVNLTQTTQYRVVLQGERGSCPVQYSGLATVTVLPRAAAQPGPALQQVCGSTATLTGNLPAGSTGEWIYVSGPSLAAQVVTIGAQGQAIGLSDDGDHVFRWRVGNSVCGFSTQDVVVRKIPGATAAIAGPFQQICGDTARVVGNAFESWESGVWTIVQAPVGSNPFITSTNRVGLLQGLTQTGIYIIEWTITNPLCGESSSAQVQIERLPTPTAAVVPANQELCGNTVQLQGNQPTEGVGTWSYVTGPSGASINQVGVFANIQNLDQAGLHVFRYTIDNGVCPPSFGDVEVTVVQGVPVASVTATSVTVCGGTTAVLEAIAPTAGSGTWRFVTGPANPQVVTSGVRGLVSGLTSPGVYQFEWTVTNACGSDRRSVEVTVNDANFTPAFGGADQFICDKPSALVSGNAAPLGGTGMWRFVSGPVVASVTTFGGRFGSIVNMDVAGEYVFEWVISVPGCAESVSQVSITRIAPPTTAFAGPNQTICASQAILQGNVPVNGVGRWTYVGGPSVGVSLNYTNNNAVASGLTAAGIHEFDYFIENPPCPPSVSRVRVTVNPAGQPGVLSLQSGSLTVCSGANAGTLQLAGHVGNVVRWESSEDDFATFDIIPITGTVHSYSNLTTTTSFRAIVRSGSCGESASNSVKIRVRPNPGTAVAGPSQQVCGTVAQLQGNAPAPGVFGTWSFGGGPSVPSVSQNGNEATVTGLSLSGDYVFTWTLEVPGCGMSSSNVLVSVSTGSVGGSVSADATVCSGANGGVLTLSGQQGGVVRWERSTNNWVSSLPTVTSATTMLYTNLTQTTRYRAVVKEGVCPEVYSTEVEIMVTPAVAAANGGPDQVICGTTTELNGNAGGVAVGSWTQASGPAANLQPVGSKLTVRDMVPGVYVFDYTLDNGVCGTSVDQVVVTVNAPSAGGLLTSDATACAGANSGTLSLSGQVGDVIRWERSTDNFATVFPIASTATTLGWASLSATTQYRAVVKSGVCAAVASNTVQVTVVPATPAATVGGGPFTTCGASHELIGSTPGSGTPVWTLIGGPGAPTLDVNGSRVTVRNLGVGVTTVEYRIDNPPCAPTSTTVSITRVAAADGGAVTADAAVVCGGANAVNFSLAGETGSVLRWETSTDGFVTVNTIVNTTNALTLNNLTQPILVRAIVSSAGCGMAQSLAALVNVVGPLPAANAGLDQTICSNDLTLTGNDPGPSGTGTWTQSGGAPATVIPSGMTAQVTGLTTGVYTFRYEITGAPCVPTMDEVQITVQNPPVAGVLTASASPVCAGANSGTIDLAGHVGTVVGWEISANSFASFTTDNVSVVSYPFANLTATTQYRALIANGNCPPVRTNPVAVVVDQPSAGGVVLADVTVCTGSNGGNLTLQSQLGQVVRWERSTDAINWNSVINTSPTQPYLNLTASESFRAVVKNGVCAETNSTPATVTVSTSSIAGTISGGGAVCSGTNSSVLTLSGQNGNVMDWEFSTDPTFTSFGSTGVTQPTLPVNNLTVTTYYRAKVRSGNCDPAYTGVATIMVNPPSAGGVVSSPATVCAGTNAGVLTLGGQVGDVVRWETASDAAFSSPAPLSETGVSVTYANLTATTCYRAVVQNMGCSPAFSQPACVEVRTASAGGAASGATTVCASGNGGSVTLSGQNGSVVRWESATNAAFTLPVSVPNSASATLTYSNLTATTWYRAVVENAPCAPATSSSVKISVDQPSVSGQIAGATSVCGGTASGTLSVSGHVGDVVRWEVSTDNFGNDVQTAQSGPSTTLAYSTGATRWYRVAVRNGVCGEALSGSVEVNVSAPSAGGSVSGSTSVCGGLNGGTLVLTGQVGQVVRWEYSANASFTPATPLANETSTSLTFTNLTASRFYRAVVRNGACAEAFSSAAQVTVNPPITLNAGSVVGCTGQGSITAQATGGVGGFIYSLTPAVAASNSSGNFPSVSPGTYTVSAVDASGCSATVSNVVVGTTPTPTQIISISNVTNASAVVQWAGVAPFTGVVYTLRYKVANSPTWTVLTGLTTTFRLVNGLQAATDYEVEVQYACPNNGPVSGFSTGLFRTFRTTGTTLCSQANPSQNIPVPVPGGVFVDNVSANGARVNWNAVADAAGYIVSWGVANTNESGWPQAVVCNPTTQFMITGLVSGFDYQVKVRTNCSNCTTASQSTDILRSNWSPLQLFRTLIQREASASTLSTDGSLVVYPNPNRGLFTVRLPEGAEGVSLALTDVSGRAVWTSTAVGSEVPVDVSGVGSGLYLLRAVSGDRTWNVKVVVE